MEGVTRLCVCQWQRFFGVICVHSDLTVGGVDSQHVRCPQHDCATTLDDDRGSLVHADSDPLRVRTHRREKSGNTVALEEVLVNDRTV